jgi:predicted ribosomally synthesized peptide with SipW-like signal peptide
MKKIIVLTLAALLTLAAVASGTWAFFSDNETSQNNVLTAGTLDLQVGASDPCAEAINTGALEPGDSGNAADWTVTNKGNLTGALKISIGAITNYENTLTEPETAVGDVTGGATEGELGDYLKIAFWLDINRSGGWDSGDKYLKSDGTVVDWVSGSTLPSEAYANVNSYSGIDWETADGMPTLAGLDELYFNAEYSFTPNTNDSRAQGDSCLFDISFSLDQVT